MDAGRRHETPESETKDTFSQGSKHHIFHVHISSPVPSSPTEHPRYTQHMQGVCIRAAQPQLRTPDSFYYGLITSKPDGHLAWGETQCFYNEQQNNLPSTLDGATLSWSSKAVCYTNILEKIIWNKGHQHLSSQEVQKLERPMENYFPTDTAPVSSWRSGQQWSLEIRSPWGFLAVKVEVVHWHWMTLSHGRPEVKGTARKVLPAPHPLIPPDELGNWQRAGRPHT